MPTKINEIVAFSIMACLISIPQMGCASSKGSLPLDQVAFVSIEPYMQNHYEVKFKENGKETGLVTFDRRNGIDWEVTIKRGHSDYVKLPAVLLSQIIKQIGTIDLSGKGNEDVFVVMWDGGTGFHSIPLIMINPQRLEHVELNLTFAHDPSDPITDVHVSDNYHRQDFQSEREFLERIKYEYGFIDEQEIRKQSNNPEFAYYFWKKENGKVEDGTIAIRKYKGRPPQGKPSVTDELREDNIIYKAYFKAGVIAYDESTDEHYVLFHPEIYYAWPIALRKIGPYLLICTRGEGIIIINTRSLYLKRFSDLTCSEEDFEKLEVMGSRVRIQAEIELDF